MSQDVPSIMNRLRPGENTANTNQQEGYKNLI